MTEPTQDNAPRRPSVAIAEIPITLAPESNIFEIKLPEPGIVRAVGFWIHEPKVMASAVRGVQKIAMPLLFVECDPSAPMPDRPRVFAFLPSGAEFAPRPDLRAKYCATALHGKGAMHLFELVQGPS